MRLSNFERALPSIRVAVTETCNLRCEYCPAHGDSVEMQSDRLDTEDFEAMITAAVEVGFTDFSFTGGEPLAKRNSKYSTIQSKVSWQLKMKCR